MLYVPADTTKLDISMVNAPVELAILDVFSTPVQLVVKVTSLISKLTPASTLPVITISSPYPYWGSSIVNLASIVFSDKSTEASESISIFLKLVAVFPVKTDLIMLPEAPAP